MDPATAKTKICPIMSRAPRRESELWEPYLCQADDCMAWIWRTRPAYVTTPDGFCGIAGKEC